MRYALTALLILASWASLHASLEWTLTSTAAVWIVWARHGRHA